MNLFKLIAGSILLIVIVFLSEDYIKTYYFTKKRKKKEKTSRYNVDNPEIVDVTVDNTGLQTPVVELNEPVSPALTNKTDTKPVINEEDNLNDDTRTSSGGDVRL